MTVQADFARRPGQHAGMVAAMDSVALPAVTFLDRHMLCCCSAVFMTGQAKSALRGFYSYGSTFNLVTLITVPLFYRLMDYLFKQCRLVGAVLCVAVYTVCRDRVILMGGAEVPGVRLMAGSTQKIGFIVQQSGLIGTVGIMAGKTALENRCVNMGLGELLAIMAGKTGLLFSGLEKLGELRVVRIMAGGALTCTDWLMNNFFVQRIPERQMAWQTEIGFLLTHQEHADQAVGQVTGCAVIFPDRSVDISHLETCHHICMAFDASLADRFGARCGRTA
jgi:hypothetical protein